MSTLWIILLYGPERVYYSPALWIKDRLLFYEVGTMTALKTVEAFVRPRGNFHFELSLHKLIIALHSFRYYHVYNNLFILVNIT